jgi:hypothetical protein
LEDWVVNEKAQLKNPGGGTGGAAQERKEDFSTAQTDTFAGAKVKEKSVGLLRSK